MVKVVMVSMQIILTLSHQLNQFQQDNEYFILAHDLHYNVL
jgi:hypothetical protein